MKVLKEIAGAPKPVGPYSVAVISNGLIFCAGQIGIDPVTSQLVSGGVKEQTEQVLRNIEAVLAGAGSSVGQIVMTSIFLTDIRDGKLVNQLYGEFVRTDSPPARQTVAVKELPLEALIEISVIAAV